MKTLSSLPQRMRVEGEASREMGVENGLGRATPKDQSPELPSASTAPEHW